MDDPLQRPPEEVAHAERKAFGTSGRLPDSPLPPDSEVQFCQQPCSGLSAKDLSSQSAYHQILHFQWPELLKLATKP